MALSTEQLRRTAPRKTTLIPVPAWADDGDDQVCIAVLTGTDSAELLAISAKDRELSAEYVLAYVARAVVDPETLERVFDDAHLDILRAKPGHGLRDVFNEAVTFNQGTDAAVAELAKNSGAIAGDDSGSASLSIPDSATPA